MVIKHASLFTSTLLSKVLAVRCRLAQLLLRQQHSAPVLLKVETLLRLHNSWLAFTLTAVEWCAFLRSSVQFRSRHRPPDDELDIYLCRRPT